MWIPFFFKIARNHTHEQIINDSTLVIDGQNYFYELYEKSGLSNEFGSECDNYFQYLKKDLNKFKMAGIKCYFIFKGGHKQTKRRAIQAIAGLSTFVAPIFMRDVHIEILEEMGFKYAYCENETKLECMALSQHLKCPVLSNDVGFCIYGVPYINFIDSLHYDEDTCVLKANIFRLNRFLQKTELDKSKLATFAVLTDVLGFPKNHFSEFIKAEIGNMPCLMDTRYEKLFRWLSQKDSELADAKIFQYISDEDQVRFREKKNEVMDRIQRDHSLGVVSRYLMNDCQLEVAKNDPLWFEKGVASTITLPYVNLYRRNTVSGVLMASQDDPERDDPRLLSSDIIKYAHNLLTNFSNTEFVIMSSVRNTVQRAPLHIRTDGIPKPNYEANESVFENGWENIKQLKLFEHFLMEQFQGIDFEILYHLPQDAKLLMISLLYFKRFCNNEVKDAVVGSILLSYIALGVVNQKTNDCNNNMISSMTANDKKAARNVLSAYSKVKQESTIKLMYPLVEFQHCLSNLDSLNKLCGSPFKPILYHRMYNGAFVYTILHEIVQSDAEVEVFVSSILECAPTVLNFMNGLFNIYKNFN